AASELSKARVDYYEAQKNLAQVQVQLNELTGLPATQLVVDTNAEQVIMHEGAAYALATEADTSHHPYITLSSSVYDLSNARLKLEKSSYYPKLFVNVDAWARGSSLSNTDHFGDIYTGYEPSRFNYLASLTLTYDIFNIARKHFNSAPYRFQAEAAYHALQNEKDDLKNAISRAQIETDFEAKRAKETQNELSAAANAYTQQLSLYNSGLSSIIELNTALRYYIQAQRDYLEAKTGYMKSIINYSLAANSFNGMVQTLKL
ncbi:MAG TPA: TolC family protein, partial [Chitinophagales bacterium]|nr:TolC family protein [Chitinophagales bacterium]